jgi:uncharacterized protein with gpF-like domain
MARKPAFISHSREREAQIQSRMLDVLERRFRRRIAAAIVIEGDRIRLGYVALGYVPPVSDQHAQDVREVYRQLALASAKTFGRRIVTRGKALGLDLETKDDTLFSLFQAFASAWVNLEPVRRRIQSVSDTTRSQIVSIVAQGQREGLGVEAIAAMIGERLPEIGRWRGALIARTETHGAANFATHEIAKTTGMQLEKEWVAVEDMRTRRIAMDAEYDHAAMDGQRVAFEDPFLMPWRAGPDLPIMYPGEAGKPGGATINCRCAVIHHPVGGFDLD